MKHLSVHVLDFYCLLSAVSMCNTHYTRSLKFAVFPGAFLLWPVPIFFPSYDICGGHTLQGSRGRDWGGGARGRRHCVCWGARPSCVWVSLILSKCWLCWLNTQIVPFAHHQRVFWLKVATRKRVITNMNSDARLLEIASIFRGSSEKKICIKI